MIVSVLVVEDEPGFLQRFCDAIAAEPALRLCGAATTVAGACTLVDALVPDVVLVDLGLPDGSGVDVIRHAMHGRPTRDVMVVTMFGDDGHVIDSIRAGATGYLLKDALPKDITASILQVHGGGSPISPAIARRVLTSFGEHQNSDTAEKAPHSGRTARSSVLSERETEILRLVGKGLNFKEVAGVLAISPNTVITHVKRIYQKLAVHSRGEAVYEANQMGWL
ncbi:response regulator transcription factor [Ramlibacter sp. WS9]|uniref:LuxR C-terminal-related transcriptional regulator n=1 Tax=Ramlibacter sp. WS9 TaxID=1882741 RepID=UPI00114498AA|nr:response regulator transcription factor [Ramlibacter sp. WS9]ROZ69444.1 DNA-binding response regulator [Ramlibacter sp. WS9]